MISFGVFCEWFTEESTLHIVNTHVKGVVSILLLQY